MTLCIKTKAHCVCQPDEGVFCPDYKPDWYVQCLMDAITELRKEMTHPEGGAELALAIEGILERHTNDHPSGPLAIPFTQAEWREILKSLRAQPPEAALPEAQDVAAISLRAMVFKAQWQEADPEALEPWFTHWMQELTAQGLHGKADIATVLAILSKRLEKSTPQPAKRSTTLHTCPGCGFPHDRNWDAESTGPQNDFQGKDKP